MVEELVSIITPTYNCESFIIDTIKSVLAQTYQNWELIIIDDRSSDNTVELVKSISQSEKRIKLIAFSENQGPAIARTEGIKLAKGVFIAFLDSDDLWHPDKLRIQISFMKFNNYAFSCTSYEHIKQDGQKTGKIIKSRKKTDYNRMLLSCPVGNSSVIYNSYILGKFEVPNIKKRNDDALWLQILKKEKYIYGNEKVLMFYRLRNNSISRNKFHLIKYHWLLYRKIEHLSILRSSFHIFIWIIIKVLRLK